MKAHQSVEGARPGEDVKPMDGERERFLKLYGYVGEDGDGNPPEGDRSGPDYLMADQRDVEREAEYAEKAKDSEHDDTPSGEREGAKSRAYTAMVEDQDRDKAFEEAGKSRQKAAEAAEKSREQVAKAAESEQSGEDDEPKRTRRSRKSNDESDEKSEG